MNVWLFNCLPEQIDVFTASTRAHEAGQADGVRTIGAWPRGGHGDAAGSQTLRFIAYQQALFDRRQEWALCFRAGLPTRGHNTNNTVEAAMRVLKDNVLHR